MSLERLLEKASKPIRIKKLIEEAQKDLTPKGSGVTCMIQNKYSREYTDFYLNQLAEFFGFDFFKNRKEECLAKLKPNQRFKPYREYLEDFEYDHMQYIVDSAYKRSTLCEHKEKSQKLFEDMMFFDGLIMNNKRNIDDFGFIVDVEDESKKYEFVCFYDDYNSMFDHLNGIDEEQYYNVIKSLSAWTDNDISRHFILSTMLLYVQQHHIDKIQQLLEDKKVFSFKDNELFQIYEMKNIEFKNNICSIYDFHIQRSFSILPGVLQNTMKRKELIRNPKKLEEFMLESYKQTIFNRGSEKKFIQQKIQNYIEYTKELTEYFRLDASINPRKTKKS